MTTADAITGGCQCGAIRWRAEGTPRSAVCHCENCRRAGGAQAVAWWIVSAQGFSFTAGEPSTYTTDAGGRRSFCGRCGSQLTYVGDGRDHEVDITAGTADDPDRYPPAGDSFTEDKISWVPLTAQSNDVEEEDR